jgi:putative PIN family toxin of toxin-antitoxin system
MKVILDTNVLVSAFISKSYPAKILEELILKRKVELCLSNEVLEEYIQVLNRDKFSRFLNFKEKSSIVLFHLKQISLIIDSPKKVDIMKDKSDNKFLDLAVNSKANYLITGNTIDFTFSKFRKTVILSPKEFWEIYNS